MGQRKSKGTCLNHFSFERISFDCFNRTKIVENHRHYAANDLVTNDPAPKFDSIEKSPEKITREKNLVLQENFSYFPNKNAIK